MYSWIGIKIENDPEVGEHIDEYWINRWNVCDNTDVDPHNLTLHFDLVWTGNGRSYNESRQSSALSSETVKS